MLLVPLAFLAVLAISLADLVTPREVSFAALAAVPIACLALAGRRSYRHLLGLALALIAVVAASGAIAAPTAIAAAAGCGAAAVLGRTAAPGRSRTRSESARAPAPQAAPIFMPGVPDIPAEARLTRRQRDVVELAIVGLTAKEIGERLFIGERTVETHLANSYGKLGVKGKHELLVRYRAA